MRIAVILASLGRHDIVSETNRRLAFQTRPPDLVCISVANPEDAPRPEDAGASEIVLSPLGSCAQRNRGLEQIGNDADIVTFFDDDFVPSPTYLERLESYFQEHPDIAGVTGLVLADGVTGPGLSFDDADRIIADHSPTPMNEATRIEQPSLYGCNMSYRRKAIEGLHFDESLPLYGWLEDVDFSARVRQRGPMIKTDAVSGVHLGVKGGRTSGVRLGYSQVVNPIYLHRKRTITAPHSATLILRNMAANHAKALAPEPYVDRWGRVKGNWLAIKDVLSGNVEPQRILSL